MQGFLWDLVITKVFPKLLNKPVRAKEVLSEEGNAHVRSDPTTITWLSIYF